MTAPIRISIVLAIFISFAALSSCLTTKTTVGTFKEETGEIYTFDKTRQFWLFWGMLPLGRTNADTPTDGSCEIITRRRPGDILVTVLTVGIVSSYSVIVRDKRPN